MQSVDGYLCAFYYYLITHKPSFSSKLCLRPMHLDTPRAFTRLSASRKTSGRERSCPLL